MTALPYVMDVGRIYCRGLFLPKQMLNLVKGRSTVDARTTEARKELQDATGRPMCALDTRPAVFKHNAHQSRPGLAGLRY